MKTSRTPITDAEEQRQVGGYNVQLEIDWPAFPADFDFARKFEIALNDALAACTANFDETHCDHAIRSIKAIAEKALGNGM